MGLRPQRLNVGTRPVEMVIGANGDSTARIDRPGGAQRCWRWPRACSSPTAPRPSKFASRVDPKYGVSSSPRVVAFGEPVPKGGGTYRVGKPYTVAGRVYVPEEDPNYRAEGMASWYGDDFHGRLTANGEVFDMASLTAAHPTLPIPSYARVTNLRNGKSLIVRVNDRGPYHGNRLIDVSNKAAELLEFKGNGVATCPGRICRAGAARRLRRPPADGDAADRRARAVALDGPGRLGPAVRSRNLRRPRAGSGARFRCRKAGPIASAIPRPTTPRSTRPRKCRPPAGSRGRSAENPRAVSYDNDANYAAPGQAYRPVDPRGPSEVLSGRGLY